MISIEEAQKIILSQISPLGAEVIALGSASGRSLGNDITADRDHPPSDQSAMDGFALRWEDVRSSASQSPQSLKIIGEQPAGKSPNRPVGRGEALRIMTGAMMPPGADTVVQVEHTQDLGTDGVAILKAPSNKGLNIRVKGEYIKKGETLLRQGTRLGPPQIGLLSAIGLSAAPVYLRPTVSIIATGDEIVGLDATPAEYQIFNSNSHLLAAMVKDCGGQYESLGIARDVEADIEKKLVAGSKSDIIITTGGVSVGNFDLVKGVLKRLGSELLFWKVAIKPGKPLVFGRLHGKLFFGLPGNPVASYIAFHQFVQPAIKKLSGFTHFQNQFIHVKLASDVQRKMDGRKVFLSSVIYEENGEFFANPLPGQGSGNLKLICDGNGFIVLSGEKSHFKKGETVSGFFLL